MFDPQKPHIRELRFTLIIEHFLGGLVWSFLVVILGYSLIMSEILREEPV